MTGIILFDGQCVFCDHSVQFILKRDVDKVFQFASLQSDIGQQLLKQYNVDVSMDSIVIWERIMICYLIHQKLIKEFIKFYSRFGGRYSVLSDDETIISLKEMELNNERLD